MRQMVAPLQRVSKNVTLALLISLELVNLRNSNVTRPFAAAFRPASL